jgi:hypothetical protein
MGGLRNSGQTYCSYTLLVSSLTFFLDKKGEAKKSPKESLGQDDSKRSTFNDSYIVSTNRRGFLFNQMLKVEVVTACYAQTMGALVPFCFL